MAGHTYSVSEIVGTSTEGVDDAIKNGIATASQTLRNLDWFEVKEIRGHLEDGAVAVHLHEALAAVGRFNSQVTGSSLIVGEYELIAAY